MTGNESSNPLDTLLQRLRSPGGRFAVRVSLTSEERSLQPEPTFGGKGYDRWLTADEYRELTALLECEKFAQPLSCETHGLVPDCAAFNHKCASCEVEGLRAEVEAMDEEIAKCRELIPSNFQAEDLHVMVQRLKDEFYEAVGHVNCLAVQSGLVIAEKERLQVALEKYGRHPSSCEIHDGFRVLPPCTCGLSEALRPAVETDAPREKGPGLLGEYTSPDSK